MGNLREPPNDVTVASRSSGQASGARQAQTSNKSDCYCITGTYRQYPQQGPVQVQVPYLNAFGINLQLPVHSNFKLALLTQDIKIGN